MISVHIGTALGSQKDRWVCLSVNSLHLLPSIGRCIQARKLHEDTAVCRHLLRLTFLSCSPCARGSTSRASDACNASIAGSIQYKEWLAAITDWKTIQASPSWEDLIATAFETLGTTKGNIDQERLEEIMSHGTHRICKVRRPPGAEHLSQLSRLCLSSVDLFPGSVAHNRLKPRRELRETRPTSDMPLYVASIAYKNTVCHLSQLRRRHTSSVA